jgi:hypothetical protein
MEVSTIAIVCAPAFGVVAMLSTFIGQVLLSRDKALNEKAQKKALNQELFGLEKLRKEIGGLKGLDADSEDSGVKGDVQELDANIKAIFKKKSALVERYAEMVAKESNAVICKEQSLENQEMCKRFKNEIDKELSFYQQELQQLQMQRDAEGNVHSPLRHNRLEQEKQVLSHLQVVYERHVGLLEKVYLRHDHIEADTAAKFLETRVIRFNPLTWGSVTALKQCFKASKEVDKFGVRNESMRRQEIADAQDWLNNLDDRAPPGVGHNNENLVPLKSEWTVSS